MAEAEHDDRERGPRWTSELAGHAAAERTLRDTWAGGRMPHAWLITGARGIGKATLAYRFVRTVLAGAAHDTGPSLFAAPMPSPGATATISPSHPVFRRIARNAHPDLMSIERPPDKEEIIVESARRAVDFFTMTPAEGGWRVLIVDAADELNRSAANALLKVIEEPPQRGLILLLSHRPGLVLPTIRSRCRRLALRPLVDTEVAKVVAREWPELAPEIVAGLVAMSEGSPGRAMALAEADGFAWYRDFLGWLTRLPAVDAKAMHALADRVSRRDSASTFRTLMTLPTWSIARMVEAGGGHPPGALVAGEGAAHAHLLERRTIDHWAQVWEQLSLFVARAAAVNLDRRHIALNVFSALGRAAKG